MAVRFLKIVLVALLIPAAGFAATKKKEATVTVRAIETTRDANYIYHRTPYQFMAHSQRNKAVRNVVRLFDEKLKKLRDSGRLPEILSLATLPALKLAHENIDILSEEVSKLGLEYVDASKKGAADLIPSALIINLAIKGTKAIGIGGGGTISIGLVVLPYWVSRQSIVDPADQAEYVEYEYSLIGFGGGDVGFGASAGAVTRISVGAIWGALESPKDFVGILVAGSVGFSTPITAGVNLKSGVVHNGKKPGMLQYKFAMVGLEWGPGVNLELRANGGLVFDGMKVLAGLGIEGVDAESIDIEKFDVSSGRASFRPKDEEPVAVPNP